MELNKIYFYTATIVDWKHLLKPKKYKRIITDSLSYLVRQKQLAVYGFVIMPNHIHIIWELLKMNGKEMPHSSFMKFTSHQIQKDLVISNPALLRSYTSDLSTREYHFWQRDSMAFDLYSPTIIFQKLNYIHNNPVQGKWMLADSPVEYEFSSSKFYDTGSDKFDFLTHIGDRI